MIFINLWHFSWKQFCFVIQLATSLVLSLSVRSRALDLFPFFFVYLVMNEVEVKKSRRKKYKKKNDNIHVPTTRKPITNHIDRTRLVSKGFILPPRELFSCGTYFVLFLSWNFTTLFYSLNSATNCSLIGFWVFIVSSTAFFIALFTWVLCWANTEAETCVEISFIWFWKRMHNINFYTLVLRSTKIAILQYSTNSLLKIIIGEVQIMGCIS